MFRIVPQVLPSLLKLYPDLLKLAPGPLSALIPIRAYSPHVTCFSVFLVAGLGLEAPYWLALGVMGLFSDFVCYSFWSKQSSEKFYHMLELFMVIVDV